MTGSQGSVLTNSNLPPHPSFLSHLSTPVLNHLDSTLSKSPEHLDDSPARQSDTNSKVTGYLSHSEEDVVKDLASQVTEPSSTGTHQDNVSLSKICEALCLKMVGERSGFQSAGHPDDRQVRQSATKSPAKAHPHLSTAGSAVQHSDPQIIESCKPENNTVGKPSCIVKDSLKQGYNKEKVKKSSADTSQVGKKSVPHKSLTEGSKAKRKRSVYSYSSSEEEGGTPLNTLAKIKRKRTSQPRRKKENAEKQSKRASEVSVGDKMPRRSKRISKRSTVDNKKPKVIEECASTLKAKAEVHYPGYSSEWSSAESESASKNGSTVATRAVKVKRQTDDQDSAQKSIVSTSSWTSSERNKKDGEKLKVNNKTVSTGPPDSELCEGGLNSQVSQHQNVSNVESSDGGAVGDKEANTLIDNRESLPLAPDSVDMEVESQLLNTRSSSQQKNSSDVTVIPDTQEMLTDIDNDSCNELAVECPGSPVIPLQNGSKDAGLYNMEDDVVKSTDNEISDSNKVKLSSTGLPLSDMESHQMTSVADGRSTQLTVRQKRKQLLENIIKQKPKYRCSHGSDSTPNAQSKDNVSSLRKRAKLTAEIVSTNSQPCRHPAEGPSDLDSKKSTITKVKSIVGISKSDSEFTNPTTRRLLSLSRRKVGTKPSMANIPVTIDDRVESSGEMCEQTKKPSNKQQSGLPKEECLDIDVSKQKEADSGVSSTNASEVTHSPSVTINKVNAKSQAMSRKTKAKKRGTEDVIKISSCSEPEAFKPPPFKKRKPRPRFSSERMVTPTSTEADRAPSMSAAEQSPVNDSDSETSDYNGLPEQNTTTIEGQGSNKKDAPTITSPRSSEVETDQVKEDDSPEGRVEDSVSVANTKSNGNTSSKQGSLLTKEVWDTTDGDTESSDSSDSDGTDAGKAEQRKGTRPADSDNLDKKDKTSKLNKVTALLDTSSSSFSSSNEEADSVAKPASTRQKTSDKQSSVGHRLDDTSKIEKAKLSLSQKEQEKPVPKKKGAASPKRKAKGVVNPPQHLEQSSSESESADEEGTTQGLKSTVISQQSLKKSGRGRTNEPGKETTHPARTSPKKRLQKNLRSQVSTTRGPPRFLFSRTTTKKNYPQQLSKPVKQTGKAKGSYESENSTGNVDLG